MPNMANTSLGEIKTLALTALDSADARFKTATENLDTTNLTMGGAVKYQADLTLYSIVSQAMSAVIKEVSDSLKAIINKF